MSQTEEECVLKRNGVAETVSFDKILKRIKILGDDAGGLSINYTTLCRKIIDQLYNKIPTREIDELTAQQCASLSTKNDDYGVLASRVLISNHQKNTNDNFSVIISKLYDYVDMHGKHHPLISKELSDIVLNNGEMIQSWFDFDRDFLLDYFGFKTLERAYLMKINGVIVERPQHMWMRVAIGIHGEDFEAAKMTYDLMSQKYFTHATPTLFNAGTPRPQMSSCYLLAMENDSINGIYNTLHDCASISKWAGGIGLHIHNVRAEGSHIRGTNGTSNGIVPMLQVFNYTARYVDQGGGKRSGSFAIYLEPWHGDIESFLDMKKNHGDEELRARDLFYALWIPDLFMERVRDDLEWTLMCPDKCPGLSDAVGDDFKQLYEKYEKENKGIKVVKARKIWLKILDSQMETGVPYMLYKDAANSKSNQKNLGTIRSSNLCCEIQQYSDSKETAVCNLASIALGRFVSYGNFDNKPKIDIYTINNCKWCKKAKKWCQIRNINYTTHLIEDHLIEDFKKAKGIDAFPLITINDNKVGGFTDLKKCSALVPNFDYQLLHDITKVVTENLNKVIDRNFYPTEKTRVSNMKHRPVGIGIQGLADTFALMDIPFHSDEAKIVNSQIFETIYHAALEKSMELAQQQGKYETFDGSPASKGILQFDMWGVYPTRYPWSVLKEQIKLHGLRNSLLVAPMPTASTSQILGFNECFEPFTSNIYLRRTLAGEFVMVNKYLMNELSEIDLWTDEVKNEIIKIMVPFKISKLYPNTSKKNIRLFGKSP
ncbi:MAG: ribonucleoside-diphosphate reductase subunit alpha [Pelagibacterales bacterium]|nr:ribonucleoside-diphosphate reductase subunit alpha [Pelagibacterales bacterium]